MFAKLLVAAALMAPATALAAPLTDPQIAHIATTADNIDIAGAQEALQKSTDARVRGFADQIVGDDTAVNAQLLILIGKLSLTPQDNPTSHVLTARDATEKAKLAKLGGAAFDRAYAANEVSYYKLVNRALQKTLIPDAQNGELKALLQTGLKLFTLHQEHAEQLVAELK